MNSLAQISGDTLYATMATLMFAVFTVSVSFGVPLPLFPDLIERLLGAGVVAAQVSRHSGLLATVYSLFLLASLWGRLFDRWGGLYRGVGSCPGEVFIDTGPEHAEGKTEKQFFQRHAEYLDATQGTQVPYALYIFGRRPRQPGQEDDVETQKQAATDPGFVFELRAAPRVGQRACSHGDDTGVDRIPWQEIKRREHNEGSSQGDAMKAVPQCLMFDCADRHRNGSGENVVEHDTDAADGKTENQTLDVESRARGEIEQAGRVPIFGHEQGFGEAERSGEKAGPAHGAALLRKESVDSHPGQEESAGPHQPDILIGNHHVDSTLLRVTKGLVRSIGVDAEFAKIYTQLGRSTPSVIS